MMVWLGDWLKQVILIILIAAFVDLLLPNQAMQRYVKTVVSLFILMTLLTPVFELFQRGWDADKLLAEAEQLQSGKLLAGGSVKSDGNLKSLAGIMADSRKLQAKNGQEAKKLAEIRLAEEMKAGLEQATGVKVGELTALINTDHQGNPVIGSVRAILLHKLAPDDQAAGSSRSNPIGQVRVEEVKPVSIAVGPLGGLAAGAVKDAAAAPLASDSSSDIYNDAERYFRQEWKLAPDRLSIQVDL